MGTKIISIFILNLLVFATTASSFQKPDWKGKVEYENGVEIIKNPIEPQYSEISFELKEDLSIEDKDGANYFFQWLVDIDVDNDGNIFVLDKQQCKVFIFDKEGHYVKAIGGKGQGPGKFISPKKIIFDCENRINVLEDRRLHKFDGKFEFVNTIDFRFFLMTCSLYGNGNILALTNEMNPKGLTQRIDVLNPGSEKTKTIAEHTIAMDKLENPSSSTGFGPMLYLSPFDKEMSIYWNSAEYRLFLIDSFGGIVRIIEKDELQKKEHYFTRLFTCEDGLIFVERGERGSEKEWISYFDVFDNYGYYIYKAYTDGISADIIKTGYIYTLDMNSETGAQYIKRYKIKNWEKIKEGI